ncbi:hypothetical protein QUW37_05715 [Ligilactobacillus aviarius]|uniref:hypothetical protein n=1 Tax=Ligilactobacillus aviarius TaxID=1606 RepID=UPI0025A39D1A|nr:hypothetical protein [Ligilactobacillus aviarius]MDM8278724.1 hypothetical protein [Ligilactobacillus aviarius]
MLDDLIIELFLLDALLLDTTDDFSLELFTLLLTELLDLTIPRCFLLVADLAELLIEFDFFDDELLMLELFLLELDFLLDKTLDQA